jgi:hypothetical protein
VVAGRQLLPQFDLSWVMRQPETVTGPERLSSQHPPQFVWFVSHCKRLEGFDDSSSPSAKTRLGLGPVGAAFFLWDRGTKRGALQVLGAPRTWRRSWARSFSCSWAGGARAWGSPSPPC